MLQKAAKTNGSVTACSVSCARHTLPAKEELQNSFQASEGNFGLDPTQPGWIPSAAFVIQVLTSPWMANTPLADAPSPGISTATVASKRVRKDRGSLDHPGGVFKCLVCNEPRLLCCLEGALYQAQTYCNNPGFFKSKVSLLELSLAP